MSKKILEIVCFSVEAGLIAQDAGADRIELCVDVSTGGLTPTRSEILKAKENFLIPFFVMIRPRSGNFVYNDSELLSIESDILFCKMNGVKGIVFGVLDENGNVNKQVCLRLVELAFPMQCTFHRAFDHVPNQAKSLEEIIDCGFKRVLTSGDAITAIEGVNRLTSLHQQAKERIIVMPGGGVRPENLLEIAQKTKCNEFHSSAIFDKQLPEASFITEMKLILNQVN